MGGARGQKRSVGGARGQNTASVNIDRLFMFGCFVVFQFLARFRFGSYLQLPMILGD